MGLAGEGPADEWGLTTDEQVCASAWSQYAQREQDVNNICSKKSTSAFSLFQTVHMTRTVCRRKPLHNFESTS